jgi:hypothetical protein
MISRNCLQGNPMLDMVSRMKLTAGAVTMVLVSACGGGGGGGEPNPTSTPTAKPLASPIPIPTPPASVQVSGVANYELVPVDTTTGGLNYAAITNKAIRGATVQALVGSTVVATAITSNTGSYALTLPANTNYTLRVRAELRASSGASSWNVSVKDNTNADALWVLDASTVNSGAVNSVKNITAGSGWTGASYNDAARIAAPFAMLDVIYTGIQKIQTVNASILEP